jgi:signal transduction histidine kinase
MKFSRSVGSIGRSACTVVGGLGPHGAVEYHRSLDPQEREQTRAPASSSIDASLEAATAGMLGLRPESTLLHVGRPQMPCHGSARGWIGGWWRLAMRGALLAAVLVQACHAMATGPVPPPATVAAATAGADGARAPTASPAAPATAPGPAGEGPGRVWRVGVLANYPPFQLWPDGGWPGGADLDLLSQAARAIDGRVEPVRYVDFQALLADLRAGRIDVASAMARTPERDAVLAFGPPYATVSQAMVQRRHDADVPLVADLAGRRVAVVDGYASQAQVTRLFPIARQVPVADVEQGLRALLEGRADLFVEAWPAVVETIDRLQLDDLRLARRIELGSGELHLASAASRADHLAPLAAAVQALPDSVLEAARARWSTAAAARPAGGLVLDAAERRALNELPPLTVAVAGSQPPFSMAGPEGVAQGLAVDVLAAALARLGLPPPSWRVLPASQALEALRAGEVHLALGLPEEASRGGGVGYAGPFIAHPLVLVAGRDGEVWSLEQMAGRRLAMPVLQVPATLLLALHPRVQRVPCDDVAACFDAVRSGVADATVADVVSVATLLPGGRRWSSLQIVGTAGDLRHERGVALAPSVRPLVPLLQRALVALAADELPTIKQRWLERPPPREVAAATLARAAPWAAAVVVLTALLWWGHSRGLRAEVARTQASRRQAEQAAAAARRFTAFLAHEVRNSLHSVIAGTELLRSEQHKASPIADALGRSARATLALLNDLLDRERLGAGAFTLDSGPARLGPIVQAVVDEMHPAARRVGATLHWQPLQEEPVLQVDVLRVQQVLRNLLSNAIKYAAPGPIEVSGGIEAAPGDDATWRVTLCVRDHGPGLQASHQAPGEPGQRAARRGARADSTGLGLEFSRDLAQAMGGALTLAPADGGGLLATLDFPARRAAVATARAGEPLVLLAEDAEVYAMLLQRALAQAGCRVSLVGSVADARARLAAQGFDILVTDMYLPDGDAGDVLAAADTGRVRRRVVITADLDARVRALAGADAVLAKTPDVQLLVARVLGDWRAANETSADAAAAESAVMSDAARAHGSDEKA